ncbi:MAG: LacI family DNA-binding transcriptional regulator [Planctomycetes bacterium]|nr:LacI family DNA-binding transcriptional regulator [Planctomycetota bacterium]
MISSLELAKICGVSQGTVDRALHDRPGISKDTKARILAMAQKHGYRPHPAARELLTGDRKTVGAIVPSTNTPFFMDLLNTIREAIAPDGYRFFITQVNDEEECLSALNDFAARRARMAILVPPRTKPEIPDGITKSMDVIVLINPCKGDCIHILPDEVESGRVAAAYLADKGHEKIIHLTYDNKSQAVLDRAKGFERELSRRGLSCRVFNDFDESSLLGRIKDFGASAVFAHNDWLALRAIRYLSDNGMQVPDDISVLGVDDSPTFVSLCPDITTMHYPAESVAEAVKAYLADEPVPPVAPLHVVERGTVKAV